MMLNRNLEIFLKVAEYGSITKAAKTLYITQPAASNAIAKLESELNVTLFFRDKRSGLKLTEIGNRILALAKNMDDINNRITQISYEENNILKGKLKIGALTFLVSTIISKALKKYIKKYPNVIIEIKEGTPNEIFTMVEDHSVDFALSCSPFGNFKAINLIHDKIIATTRDPINTDEKIININNPSNILIINKPAYETILDHIQDKNFIKTDKVIIVQNAETAINLVNDGIGIGIISEYTLDTLAKDYCKYPININIEFDIGLFAADLKELPPLAERFIEIIQDDIQHFYSNAPIVT